MVVSCKPRMAGAFISGFFNHQKIRFVRILITAWWVKGLIMCSMYGSLEQLF